VLAGFSIPKKRFRLSVKRHRVRRLMVEAWRLHKHTLYSALPADMQLHVFLIFTGDSLPEFTTVEKAVVQCIEKLAEIHSKKAADA
jgi:ribonuclease P protein component